VEVSTTELAVLPDKGNKMTQQNKTQPEEYLITVDGDHDIAFSGEQIVYVLSQCRSREGSDYSGSSGRWTELTLYKTVGGNFVCEKCERTSWQGERDRNFGAACKTEKEVIEFFGIGWLAKKLYDEAGISSSVRIE
jgi:hypothetical protein